MPWFHRAQRSLQPPVCFVPAPSPEAAIRQHVRHYMPSGNLHHVQVLGAWQRGTLLIYAGAETSASPRSRTLLGYAFLMQQPGGWSIKRCSMRLELTTTTFHYQWTRLPGRWGQRASAVLVYGSIHIPTPIVLEITTNRTQYFRFTPSAELFGMVFTHATAVPAVQLVPPANLSHEGAPAKTA